jgi:uncharacterized protein YjbI with pentapeptide repeats
LKSNNETNIENFSPDYKIMTDEPAKIAPDFRKYSERLSNIITKSTPRFTIGIYGGWGTGKTTLMLMVKEELEKPENSDDILVIWFDAWRYENEKYLTVIPLIRTIKVAIDNKIYNESKNGRNISAGLKQLRKGVTKVLDGLAKSANLNANAFGAGASLDVEKLTDILGSEGSVQIDNEKVYYRKQHITDHLKEYVEQFRREKNARRIVIFVDDLDRCTPEKALELLESIKTFFDIEGIIYVIGMDPKSIDSIISTKYGRESKVDGLEYLQKIVQLPFSIPVWSRTDLNRTIKEMIGNIGLSEFMKEQLLDESTIGLIIHLAKLNPRNIKRFINSIVLSLFIHGGSLFIDSLISIQAFYFRGIKWVHFLELLIPYNNRIQFLQDFIIRTAFPLDSVDFPLSSMDRIDYVPQIRDREALYNFVKELSRGDSKLNKNIVQIYQKIIDINDDDFFIFLRAAAMSLLKIERIENYLRAVDTNFDTPVNSEVIGFESLDKLKVGIEEFNEYVSKFIPRPVIHLPFADLSMRNLQGISWYRANLFMAQLFDSDLSPDERSMSPWSHLDMANLSGANLGHANLSGVRLSSANLSWTFSPNTNFSAADLSGADLSRAYLSGADLSGADLSGADLSKANLSWAKMSRVNFSGTNLLGANLSNSIIINPNNYQSVKFDANTIFENEIIDDHAFIEYLTSSTKSAPKVKKLSNKKELRNELEARSRIAEDFDKNPPKDTVVIDRRIGEEYVQYLLEISILPSDDAMHQQHQNQQ